MEEKGSGRPLGTAMSDADNEEPREDQNLGSGQQKKSNLKNWRRANKEKFKGFVLANLDEIPGWPPEEQQAVMQKWARLFPDEDYPLALELTEEPELPEEDEELHPEQSDMEKDEEADREIIEEHSEPGGVGAAAIIKERMKSEPPKPPESQDVIYLTKEEVDLGQQIHTLTSMKIEDYEADYDTHQGPWIERCKGRDPETHKLMVYRIPAKEIPIRPEQVIQYLGSVVQDHQAVWTDTVVYKKRRWGYCFDKFYRYNGKRLDRCCLVLNKVHQAGLVYEKMVDQRSHRRFSRIRQLKGPMGQGTGNPMYKVWGVGEDYYRELRRLFDRHFLNRDDKALGDDVALKKLLETVTEV